MNTESTTKKAADRIRNIRLQKGLTQAVVAEKAGMHVNYYAKIERGNLAPALEAYEKIAKVLKVTAAEIFPF